MRLRQAALALAGVFGVPAATSAGEIPTPVVITTQQTPGNPSPGPLTFALDPSGTLRLTPGVPLRIGTVAFGRSSGWGDATDSFDTTTEASVSVKVTDSASGWYGTLTMPVVGYDEWDLRAWDGRWSELQFLYLGDAWGNNPASTSVVLQGWRYTLTATPDDDRLAATFTLTTAPVHTPEPGTLALGLAGVLPVGLRALRRKRSNVAKGSVDAAHPAA